MKIRLNPRIALAILVSLILTAGGCASSSNRSVSVSAWQKNVENYVKVQGQGDPTVLRDVTLPDSRKGYAMLGNPIVKDSTDAVGLLLGAPRIDGKPAFVYLVGIVQKGRTTDLRLAVLTFNYGGMKWTISPPNPQSLQAYLKYRVDEWRAASPQRHDVPLQAESFPGPQDVFTLNAVGGQVTASHQPTGASWTVRIGAATDRR
jgi:hypothetical protein